VLCPRQQIEEAFQKSIRCNARLWDAVWEYADYLSDQSAFDTAKEVLKNYQPLAEDDTPVRGGLACMARWSGEKKEGLRQMTRLLKEQPDYEYGWRRLIAWCEEDEEWELVNEMLPGMATVVRDDEYLACTRLRLMARAGTEKSELESEWKDLLHSYPMSGVIHFTRFDNLIDQERYPEAEKVLARYSTHDPDSPEVLARKIRIDCIHEDFDSARKHACDLWLYEGGNAPKSADLAIHSLHQAGIMKEVLADAVKLLGRGKRLMHSFLYKAIELCEKQSLNEEMENLIGALDKGGSVWDTSEYLAYALIQYSSSGKAKFALTFLEARIEHCMENLHLWQALGYAYSQTNKYRKCREWLSAWQEWEGIEQWIISNYCLACFNPKHFQEGVDAAVVSLEKHERDDRLHSALH